MNSEKEPSEMGKALDYFRHERAEMVPVLPEHYQRVLEIGCGEGAFSRLLDKATEYWGIEPDVQAAELARQKVDKVLIGTYEGCSGDLPDGYFDLVICNDVIEHMPDHDRFLQAISQKLTDDGCLVASIPNVRYLDVLLGLLVKRDWKYRDYGVLDRTHLRFFTKKSLLRSVRDNGYQVDVIRGINSIWDNHRLGTKIVRAIFYTPLVVILGLDVQFLQFAIRIRKAED